MEDAVNKIVSLSSDPGFISDLEKQQIEEYAREVALGKRINDEKIEIARNMLMDGVDVKLVSKYTGLSIKEIEDLSIV